MLPLSRDNLDSIIASIGAALSLAVTVYLQIHMVQFTYAAAAILALLACVGYLVLKHRHRLGDIHSMLNLEARPSIILLADIAFFALFTYSLWSFVFRPEPYVRPLEYFISISAMSTILAVKILFLPAKKLPIPLTLLQIIMVTLSLQWTVLLLFPDMVGMDTWMHRLTTVGWLDSGHIEGGIYNRLPIMHLAVGTTSLITGLGYKMAAMFSISLVQGICNALFIFLIGRLLFNAKTGLLAALLMGIANWYIFFGYWTVPNALGATLVVIILYLLLRLHKDRATVVIPFCGLLMATLLLTHVIAALWLAILLLTLWLGFVSYNRLFKQRLTTFPLLVTTALLFTVAMFGWWALGTGTLDTLTHHLQQGLSPSAGLTYTPGTAPSGITPPESESPVTPPATETLSSAPFEFLFNSLGMLLFFAASFIGGFYMLSRKFGNPYAFYIAIAGIMILGIGYFPMLLGFSVIEHRWWYLAEILLSIPLAVTFVLLLGLFSNRYLKAGSVMAFIFVLTFLSIMGFPSNQTNRTFSPNQIVRFALTTSEAQAVQTVSANYDGTIGVDGFYTKVQLTPELLTRLRDRLEWMQSGLLTSDFSQYSSAMLLIREEIVSHPFGTGSGNYYRLNYDPRQVLAEQGFHKVYDCISVSGFVRQAQGT